LKKRYEEIKHRSIATIGEYLTDKGLCEKDGIYVHIVNRLLLLETENEQAAALALTMTQPTQMEAAAILQETIL